MELLKKNIKNQTNPGLAFAKCAVLNLAETVFYNEQVAARILQGQEFFSIN